jgi:hypothetical protein
MAARLLAAVSRPSAEKCTKGRFFDRASDKLDRLGKFTTNELVPFDVKAVAEALNAVTAMDEFDPSSGLGPASSTKPPDRNRISK